MSGGERPYTVEAIETVAETPDLRVVVLTLAAGEEIPWHWHRVPEHVFCLEGPMLLETRAPRETVELGAGARCTVPMKRAHRLLGKGGGACKFALVQGVGPYDFNRIG